MLVDQLVILQKETHKGVGLGNEKRFVSNDIKGFELEFKSHEEIIVHFINQMNLHAIDLYLDKKRTYQDLPKSRFVILLGNAFEKFNEAGDTKLIPVKGYCNGFTCPNFRKNGYTFKGNNSQSFMNLIIENEDDFVSDIFQCSYFESPENGDFRNQVLIDDWLEKN